MCWIDLGEPRGSALVLTRPAVVVSADNYNRSAISTVVVAVITSDIRLGAAPGNVLLAGLGPSASSANIMHGVNFAPFGPADKEGRCRIYGHPGHGWGRQCDLR